jgi:hypothetical protein
MLNGRFHAPFAVGVSDPGGIGNDTVMRQHGGIGAIEFRLVKIGLDHALLEIVENDVLDAATKVTECLLMKARPDLAAGPPNDLTE